MIDWQLVFDSGGLLVEVLDGACRITNKFSGERALLQSDPYPYQRGSFIINMLPDRWEKSND